MAKLTDKQELFAHPDDVYVGECVIYTGYINKRGYGQKHISRKPHYAHRIAYCEANGISLDSIKDLVVRHKCDNPSCINPEHLEVGTQADNIADKVSRGRQARGSGAGRAILTEESVREIRSSPLKVSELSTLYGVSFVSIRNILRRKTWQHVV